MSPPSRKKPPRKRNLAAKALRSPLFRPRVLANPNAYRCHKRFIRNPGDQGKVDPMN
jgi:hypothetical protein